MNTLCSGRKPDEAPFGATSYSGFLRNGFILHLDVIKGIHGGNCFEALPRNIHDDVFGCGGTSDLFCGRSAQMLILPRFERDFALTRYRPGDDNSKLYRLPPGAFLAGAAIDGPAFFDERL